MQFKTNSRVLYRSLYFALPLAPALLGCGAGVYPDYTRQQPAKSDIVGTWVLTSESAQDMKVKGNYKSNNTTIQIKDDRTFSAVNLPDCACSRDGKSWFFNKGKLLTGKGKWTLQQNSFTPFSDENGVDIKFWDLNLVFESQSKSETDLWSLPPASPYPILLNQKPPYTIHIPFGDPDADDHIDFIKE